MTTASRCDGCIHDMNGTCAMPENTCRPEYAKTPEAGLAKQRAQLAADEEAALRPVTANVLLDAAAGHMRDRAAAYDKPEGERSMGRTVAAFNAITGRDLAESEGWLLLQLLKDVRDRQCAEAHRDSLEDCIAYAALKAEARLREGGTNAA